MTNGPPRWGNTGNRISWSREGGPGRPGGQDLDGRTRRPGRPEHSAVLPGPQAGHPGHRSWVRRHAVAVDELLSSRPVRLSLVFGEHDGAAARRARTVKAKATENFEERGLQTLFLAWGMATWSNVRGTAVPAAPVLLRQAALKARGGAGEDFDASLPGEWEINPTLLHLLKTDYQVEPTGLAYWSFSARKRSRRTRSRYSSGSPRPRQMFRVSRWPRGSCWAISLMRSCPWCWTWRRQPTPCLAPS